MMNVEWTGPVLFVEDLELSRTFYHALADEKVKYDLGDTLVFESGLTLKLKSAAQALLGLEPDMMLTRNHGAALSYEVDNYPLFRKCLNEFKETETLHAMVEYPWGQNAVYVYDPDGHLVTVAESMKTVCRRFLSRGMTPEEVADRVKRPLEFVKACEGE